MAYKVYRLGLDLGTFPTIMDAHGFICGHEASSDLYLLTDYRTERVASGEG